MSHSIVGSRARLEYFFLHGALNPLQLFLMPSLVEGWARSRGHSWRAGLFTPLPTVLACIYKHLLPGTSCRDVEEWAAGLLPSIPRACDGDDFCLARRRLPEPVFEQAVRHMGSLAAGSNRVWLVDGTGVSMPCTQANERHFLRPSSTARMPCAHLLLFTDAASGAVMHADIADCRQAEMRQFLRCVADIPATTVVVGDRTLCSYRQPQKAVKPRRTRCFTQVLPNNRMGRMYRIGRGILSILFILLLFSVNSVAALRLFAGVSIWRCVG